MEGKKVSKSLPEELVENIVGMMPFPLIFKARVLSKSWLARLSVVSSQDDDVKEKNPDDDERKRLAISFQRRMGEQWSTKWNILCPVFVGKEDLIAYDRASHRWQRLPSLSFLPETHPSKSKLAYRQMHGTLMLIIIRKNSGQPTDLSVANVLTRSWKQLPPRPWTEEQACRQETVVGLTDMYKVIELYANKFRVCFALIYNSKLDAWSRKTVEVHENFQIYLENFQIVGGGKYLNGVLYWLVGPERPSSKRKGLLGFNVEDETFQVFRFPTPGIPSAPLDSFYLAVCNGSLHMAIARGFVFVEYQVVRIDLDLGSPRLLKVSRGPPAPLNYVLMCKVTASDGECIFFVGRKVGGKEFVVVYNARKDEWSSVDFPEGCFNLWDLREYNWGSVAFQPGLNPFMAL